MSNSRADYTIPPLEQEIAGLIGAMLGMTAPPAPEILIKQVMCAISIALAATDQAEIDLDVLTQALPAQAPPAVIAGIESLIQMRRQSNAFAAGSSHRLHAQAPIVVIERVSLDGSERVLAVHNWSAARSAFTLPDGRWNHLDCACPVAADEYPMLEPFEAVWMVER